MGITQRLRKFEHDGLGMLRGFGDRFIEIATDDVKAVESTVKKEITKVENVFTDVGRTLDNSIIKPVYQEAGVIVTDFNKIAGGVAGAASEFQYLPYAVVGGVVIYLILKK